MIIFNINDISCTIVEMYIATLPYLELLPYDLSFMEVCRKKKTQSINIIWSFSEAFAIKLGSQDLALVIQTWQFIAHVWYYIILFDIIWYYMILFDMIWYYMILFDIIWYHMILYDIVWYLVDNDYIPLW